MALLDFLNFSKGNTKKSDFQIGSRQTSFTDQRDLSRTISDQRSFQLILNSPNSSQGNSPSLSTKKEVAASIAQPIDKPINLAPSLFGGSAGSTGQGSSPTSLLIIGGIGLGAVIIITSLFKKK